MKNDLGFLLLSIDNSNRCTSLFKTIEDIIDNNPYNQICVFNSSNNRINKNRVPVLHLNQAKFFYGNLFVFDMISLALAAQFTNIGTIFFYTTDYFWIKDGGYGPYHEIKQLYDTPNLEFISNSQEMQDIYTICWKKPLGICEEINYESIKAFI